MGTFEQEPELHLTSTSAFVSALWTKSLRSESDLMNRELISQVEQMAKEFGWASTIALMRSFVTSPVNLFGSKLIQAFDDSPQVIFALSSWKLPRYQVVSFQHPYLRRFFTIFSGTILWLLRRSVWSRTIQTPRGNGARGLVIEQLKLLLGHGNFWPTNLVEKWNFDNFCPLFFST